MEGTRILQKHTCNSNLSSQGLKSNLGGFIEKHPAQKGHITESVRASTVEAILGAVWVDSDMDMRAVDRVRKNLGVDPEFN